MRFTINGLEQHDLTQAKLLQLQITLSTMIVNIVRKYYPSNNLDDIDGYFLLFTETTLALAQTALDVIERRKDYGTTCSLVRQLADRTCIAELIYNNPNPNPDEMELRHYLYLLDGLNGRKDDLENNRHITNEERIPPKKFADLMARVNASLENTMGAIRICKEKIERNQLYKNYPDNVAKLIEEKNWRYRTIVQEKGKRNKYSWTELYDKVGLDVAKSYKYLSQYVHGMAASNHPITSDNIFDAPCYFANSILDSYFNILTKKYGHLLPFTR